MQAAVRVQKGGRRGSNAPVDSSGVRGASSLDTGTSSPRSPRQYVAAEPLETCSERAGERNEGVASHAAAVVGRMTAPGASRPRAARLTATTTARRCIASVDGASQR